MNQELPNWIRRGALLAINLLFLMIWGFAGLPKLLHGKPAWFAEKFGSTVLARFPGLTASFWLLAGAETLAFALALAALVRGDFLLRRQPFLLETALVWSLFVFLQLSFGQWLTKDASGAGQLFGYFAGTVICLLFVALGCEGKRVPLEPGEITGAR